MRNLTFLFLFVFLGICLLARAQDSVANKKLGESPYTRLREAEMDYNAAIARGADTSEIAELSYILGKRYMVVGGNHKTRYWLLRSLKLREFKGPSEEVGKIYVWLSALENDRGNTDTAMAHARKVVFNFEAVKSESRLIGGYEMLAGMHAIGWADKKSGKKLSFEPSLDSAFFYEEKALQMAISQNRTLDVGLAYCGLANLWSLKNRKGKEIEYMSRALRIFRGANFFQNEFLVLLDLGKAYLSVNRPEDAKKMLDRAQAIGDKYLDIRETQKASLEDALAFYFQKTGEWEKAFVHLRKSVEYRENEFKDYKDGAQEGTISLLESERKELELNAKNRELALRAENLQTQKKLNVVTGLLLFLTVIAGIFFFWLFKKFKRISEINAELVLEQSHRIKNNLQSVSDLLSLQRYRLSDPVAIQAMEESLLRVEAMTMVHKRLYQGNSLVSVQLKAYVIDVVESVLTSYDQSEVKVSYELQDLWLPASKAISLGLIVNELTTNACKYAFENNPEPALTIACHELAEYIIFTFSDNGPGFLQREDTNSFGLKLVDLMVANLGGDASFDTSDGTLFKLAFQGVGKRVASPDRKYLSKYSV